MERRTFLGLSAAGLAIAGGGIGWALEHRGGGEAAAVAKLADLLETSYVIPDVGKRYAAMLRSNLAAGTYASIGKTGKWHGG